jgi:hypothetical protein
MMVAFWTGVMELSRALFQASGDGDLARVRTLVRLGANVKERGEQSWTALHCAAQSGHVEVARALIALGAYPEARTVGGAGPLHMAARSGHAEVARALLELGAELDAVTGAGQTAHAISLEYGHRHVAELLEETVRSQCAVATAAASMLAGACAACGGCGPLTRCSRCLAVHYCSALCAGAHWLAHKESCAAATGSSGGGGGEEEEEEEEDAVGVAGTGSHEPGALAAALQAAALDGDVQLMRRLVQQGANVKEYEQNGDTLLHHHHGHVGVIRALVQVRVWPTSSGSAACSWVLSDEAFARVEAVSITTCACVESMPSPSPNSLSVGVRRTIEHLPG